MTVNDLKSKFGYMVVISAKAFDIQLPVGIKWLNWMSADTVRSSWRNISKISVENDLPENLKKHGFVRIMTPSMSFIALAPSHKSEKITDDFSHSSTSSILRVLRSAAIVFPANIGITENVEFKSIRRRC